MGRKHQTSSRLNDDGSTHYTQHSFEGTGKPGYRRSFDRNSDGSKSNDHVTEQSTGITYFVTDTTDGKHKAGDLTDKKGNLIRRNDGRGFARFQERIKQLKGK